MEEVDIAGRFVLFMLSIIILIKSTRLKNYILNVSLKMILFCIAIAIWPHVIRNIWLWLHGANLNGLNDYELLLGVDAEHYNQAYSIYLSLDGVGWSLSAIMLFMFVYIPLIVLARKFVGTGTIKK